MTVPIALNENQLAVLLCVDYTPSLRVGGFFFIVVPGGSNGAWWLLLEHLEKKLRCTISKILQDTLEERTAYVEHNGDKRAVKPISDLSQIKNLVSRTRSGSQFTIPFNF